jgi:hypothetical protein
MKEIVNGNPRLAIGGEPKTGRFALVAPGRQVLTNRGLITAGYKVFAHELKFTENSASRFEAMLKSGKLVEPEQAPAGPGDDGSGNDPNDPEKDKTPAGPGKDGSDNDPNDSEKDKVPAGPGKGKRGKFTPGAKRRT